MSRIRKMLAYAGLVYAGSVGAQDIDLENWMRDLQGAIGGVPISQLCLPGTHDSVTADLTADINIGGEKPPGMLERAVNALLNIVVPDPPQTFSNFTNPRPQVIGNFIEKQATTQSLNLLEQLNADGEWFGIHFTFTNTTALEYVRQMKSWLDEHPEEVLVVWMSHHGNQTTVGEDQYPGVTIEQKQEFWANITDIFFDETSASSMLVNQTDFRWGSDSTTINNLVGQKQRINFLVSDWEEMTNSSDLAINAATSLDNELWVYKDSPQDIFEQMGNGLDTMAQVNAENRNNNSFTLRSLAGEPTTKIIVNQGLQYFEQGIFQLSSVFAGFGSVYQNATATCANSFNIPDNKRCFESLLGISQMANYYNQYYLDYALKNQLSSTQPVELPNAFYVDAIDSSGNLVTGSQTYNMPTDLNCAEIAWSKCRSVGNQSFTCPDDFATYNGAPAVNANGLVRLQNTDGTKNNRCLGMRRGNDRTQCCRDDQSQSWEQSAADQSDTSINTASFSYVSLIVTYNLQLACRSLGVNSITCNQLPAWQGLQNSKGYFPFNDAVVGRNPSMFPSDPK